MLQKGEIIAHRWVSREEFLRFFHGDEAVPTQVQRWKPYLDQV
ncbi:MAG: hypothetical protein ACI4L5_00730 [Negativibacillus sp.]